MASRFAITPERFRTMTLWALIALAAIIVTGAAVRLTGSGLGCSDWPTCEQDQFVADLRFHPLIEFGNRLITGLVSLAVILAVLGSMWRVPRRADLTRWSWGLVVGVLAQIVLGMLVTKTELDPRVVIGHFLLSMVLLWNAVVLYYRSGQTAPLARERGATSSSRSLPRATFAMQIAAGAVLVAGTFVTGSGPHAGSTEDEPVERLPLDVVEMARVHSAFVYLLLAVTLIVAWLIVKGPPARAAALRPAVQRVLAVIVAQGALGYLQFALDVPAGLVALHIVGAIAMWWTVVLLRQETLAWEATHIDGSAVEPHQPTKASA